MQTQTYLPPTYSRLLARLLATENPDCGDQVKEQLFRGTDLNASDIELERCQVSSSDQYRIVANALRLSPAPGLGLRLGPTVELSSNGVMGISALTSANLREVFETLGHYYYLRVPILEIRLDNSPEGITLAIKNTDDMAADVGRFLVEAYCAMFQTITETIIGAPATDLSITLPFDTDEHIELYREFFHGELRINAQEYSTIHVPSHVADHPCPTADALLHRQAELGCQDLLEQINRQKSFTEKVESILAMENGTLLSLEEVASVLHVSRRTLIRRLKHEGSAFQELTDKRLYELSQYYLSNPNLSVEAIAHILGYSYVANFRRAFKRWSGISPRSYRQGLNSPPRNP